MELERKVELMRRYNFDGLSSNFTEQGFGHARFGLMGLLSTLRDGVYKEEKGQREAINSIYQAYGFIKTKYDTIDFGELEREIETEEDKRDFATLFKTRDILPKLGIAIKEFIAYCDRNRFSIYPNSPEVTRVLNLVRELIEADSPNYRSRLRELEGQLKTIPTPKIPYL